MDLGLLYKERIGVQRWSLNGCTGGEIPSMETTDKVETNLGKAKVSHWMWWMEEISKFI